MNNSIFTNPPTLSSQALFLEQKLALAKKLHQQGKLEDSQKGYQDLLKIQPKNAQALYGLGLIAFVQKNIKKHLNILIRQFKLSKIFTTLIIEARSTLS